MEKKQKIFAKFNIQDYKNKLEKILEKKDFSIDTKNLLLSMFYKIENSYHDYATTKVEVQSKSEFLTKLLEHIDKCKDITVAKLNSEASKTLEASNEKAIINKEEKSIIAFENELLVLDSILKTAQHNIVLPNEQEVLKEAVNNILQLGNIMNQVEVIRDFNGWSWDIVVKEIEDININLIYQTLLYLAGKEFLNDWQENTSELADYINLMLDGLKKEYGEKNANNFVSQFCKLCVDLEIANNQEKLQFWSELKNKKNEEYELLENKQNYLEKITAEKKLYEKKIEEIDKISNNKELLKEEYIKRNANLPNKEKIFSISHLSERLEKERQDFLLKIKECNTLIDPMGFVNYKLKIKKDVDFLNSLNIIGKQKTEENIIKLCNIFLECLKIKISKEQYKKELTKYFYIVRYYMNLVFDREGTTLKELPKLKSNFEKIIKLLIKKGHQLGAIDFVTEDAGADEQIITKIFDSKLIDLNNLIIITKIEDGKLFIEYYDTSVLESRIEFKSDRTLKLKKKTRLFI